MNHDKVISALGGYRVVAAHLGKDPSTVAHWRARGIPPIEYGRVMELAAEKGIQITLAALRDAAPQRSYRAA